MIVFRERIGVAAVDFAGEELFCIGLNVSCFAVLSVREPYRN